MEKIKNKFINHLEKNVKYLEQKLKKIDHFSSDFDLISYKIKIHNDLISILKTFSI